MTITEHAPVYYRLAGEEFGESVGYLSIIDGVPWMAGSVEEAQSRDSTVMFRLEPEHLVTRPNTETGELEFLYRVYLDRRPLWHQRRP